MYNISDDGFCRAEIVEDSNNDYDIREWSDLKLFLHFIMKGDNYGQGKECKKTENKEEYAD